MDRSSGGPSRPEPPFLSSRSGLWLREGHVGRGLLLVPLCALLRHAGVGSREQVQPPFPLPRRGPFWGGAPPPALGGGRPPGPGGAEGRACGSPAGEGAGGGGWGGCPSARSRACVGGGGVVGGALWSPGDASWRLGGGGRHGSPSPGGQPSAGGSRPSPAALYLEPDPPAGPRWGPSSPGRGRAALAGRGWP